MKRRLIDRPGQPQQKVNCGGHSTAPQGHFTASHDVLHQGPPRINGTSESENSPVTSLTTDNDWQETGPGGVIK